MGFSTQIILFLNSRTGDSLRLNDKMADSTMAVPPSRAKLNPEITAEPKKLSGFNPYSRFEFVGAIWCSVTHGNLTPVDVYVLF